MPSLRYVLVLFNMGGKAELVILEQGVGHGPVVCLNIDQQNAPTGPVNLSCQPVTCEPEHGVNSFKCCEAELISSTHALALTFSASILVNLLVDLEAYCSLVQGGANKTKSLAPRDKANVVAVLLFSFASSSLYSKSLTNINLRCYALLSCFAPFVIGCDSS